MKRYFIHLAYKGTNYHGWQIQPNAISVQEKLQNTFSTLLKEDIKIIGCGRTDTGVHARNFYAHFDYSGTQIQNTNKIVYKANKILPADIVVFGLFAMNNNAHSRFDATSRIYKYYISTSKEIFMADYCWQQTLHLDIKKMNEAARKLLEYNDFTSFSKLHTDVKTNICRIEYAIWEKEKNMYLFTIKADRFLRNMVRSVVGTLIDVGMGKISINDFCKIIEAKNRNGAGRSVPACGLFLKDITYPYEIKGI